MDILQAIILGIVQGISEWLPISSKSHLVLVQHLLGIAPPILFDLILHLGSFVVVLIFFWKDIVELVSGLFKKDKESWKMFWFLVVATIPAVIAGLLAAKFFENSFNNLKILGWGFLFTALVIFLSQYPKIKNKSLSFINSIIIGVSQVLALLPGVSRSGTTISSGMMLGIKKETVAKFSFLMFIPTVLGSVILELKDVGKLGDITPIIIGTLVTIVTGYFALQLLMDIIKKNKFAWFSLYCALLGIAVLVWVYMF